MMNKLYTKVGWKNEPDKTTPINETNLGKMDNGINDLDDRVIELDGDKADKTEIGTVKSLIASAFQKSRLWNESGLATPISEYGFGTPATATSEDVGKQYLDLATGLVYACVQQGADNYIWRQVDTRPPLEINEIGKAVSKIWDLGAYSSITLKYSFGNPKGMYDGAKEGSNAYVLDVLNGIVYKNTRMGESSWTWVSQANLSLITSEIENKVETLETQVQELQPSLIFMSRERRNITSDLGRLSTAVAEQNLAKYGYKIGDYFTGASGYTYTLADYNTFKGTTTPYCISTNHLSIVVDTHTTSQWHSGDASNVGYNGSTLHTYLKSTVMDNIKADMIALFGGSTGLEHLLAHSKLLTTALANWGWQTNQYISALTCTQIDVGSQWTANSYQEGEASKSLELFRKYKWTEIFGNEYLWLRNISNRNGGLCACGAFHNGILDGDGSVTASRFVVGLINFY